MKKTNPQPEKPNAPAEMGAIEITTHWNCVLIRWQCPLCGHGTDRQNRHYQIGGRGGEIICDECGEHPDQIPDRIRARATSLREWAVELDQEAQYRYVRNPSGDDPYDDGPRRPLRKPRSSNSKPKSNDDEELPF
jgi:hypothetical protein